MSGSVDRTSYLLGHSDEELTRLERQAEFFRDETEDTLRRAGLEKGMRVLDLGCGVGDVTLAAAHLVGPSGRVLGIDTSAGATETANRRLASQGVTWASCDGGDVLDQDGGGYDAIVGRFILMHLPKPTDLLRRFRRGLQSGGILAFIEMDISAASITPPMPLFERCAQAIIDVYRGAGSEPNMGSRLYATFRKAGFNPQLRGSCRVEGGPSAPIYEYLASTMRSLHASMVTQSLDLNGIDVTSLATRLSEEAAKDDYSIAYPRLTGAWARA